MEDVVAAYKKYGVLYITQFEWGGFIWRPLSRDEAVLYEGLFKTSPRAKAELEEIIFKECVIDHPLSHEGFDSWYAGIVTTVAQLILFFSTVKDQQEFLQRLGAARQDLQDDLFQQLYMQVIRVFPAYTIEQLKAMPIDTFLEKVAMLETLTGEELKLEGPQKPNIPHFIDFEAENKRLEEVDMAPPEGDWNLDRMRGNS